MVVVLLKHYGKTFREIRKGKKMTLEQSSSGIVSTSFLSKFERGESEIAFSTMVTLLDRMNVPVEHFLIIHNDFQRANYQELFQQITDSYNNADVKKLQNLYEQQGQYAYEGAQLNRIVLKCLISKFRQSTVTQEELQPLIDYLWRVDRWGEYEVLLFTYSLGNMNLQAVKVLMSDLTLKNQFFKLKINYRHSYYNVLIHTLDRFIEENAYEGARAIYKQCMKIVNIPKHFIFEQLLFHYYAAVIEWGCGNEKATQKVEEVLAILQKTDMDRTYHRLNRQWQQLHRVEVK